MHKKLLIAAIVVVGVAIAAGVYYKVRKSAGQPLSPVKDCSPVPATSGTGSTDGYGDISDMSSTANVSGTLAGVAVELGHLVTTWSADAVKKTLVIDAPHSLDVPEGGATMVDADTISIELPGWEDSSVAAFVNVPQAKYLFPLDNGNTVCMLIDVVVEKDSTIRRVQIKRQNAGIIPAKTKLPAIMIPLV